ncbi:MAG TPA: hypothetical protein VMF08_04025 [Candidatus Sulfotelmatobacter sp.]|nr:hypothetical protein [Candidatus Sulfotelmatobacter sp.]
MKPEKERLIDDLLDAQNRREATLRAGAQILRRRRHWRAARQTLAVTALVAVAAVFIGRNDHPQKTAPISVAVPVAEEKPAPVQAGVLTDEQLLALFPNTPVGLAKLSNGKKVLIFPRPADEARYVVHL